ncbi:hypothetical protein [Sediminibacillus massiliensis]|uniref:hypothetical protein n=1 Tax=Sediminibacillus massiliensis TaxID=1926277 RepID=UPI00098833F8|nr:hypothetical protein [Sediminibacillus massiliensis]
MKRLHDIEQMTLTEFHYKRYAQEYKEVDKSYDLHHLAFLIRNAAATKTVGSGKNQREEYIYKAFEEFFDYEKILKAVDEEITEPKKEDNPNKKLSPAQLALQRNSRKG